MVTCLIGLGANLGDRRSTLDAAVARLAAHQNVRLLARSQWRETPPAGGPGGQPSFLNGAVQVETSLAPKELLAALHAIEQHAGRTRDERWAARTLDLDLLLYDALVVGEAGRPSAPESLVLPHPRMAWRRFVLESAEEIAGAMPHPTSGWTIRQLLEHLNSTPWYAAITGAIGAGKSDLAARVARHCGARLVEERPDFERLGEFYGDPNRLAWQTELNFLDARGNLLAASQPSWADPAWPTVSDFWFDQSAAFAHVWLSTDDWQAYLQRWKTLRAEVVRPRLLIHLESSPAELLARVRHRGRACEQGLTEGILGRIAESIHRQTQQSDVGPVLRLSAVDRDTALAEVLAAITAMQ